MVSSSCSSSAWADTLTCPLCVNFKAFVTRLYNICMQRCASASMMGTESGSTQLISSTSGFNSGLPALSTVRVAMTMTSSTNLATWTGSRVRFTLLLCTKVEMSMMLVTKSSKRLAQLFMSWHGLWTALRFWFRRMFSLRPMMPCSGDRSSCVTVAANCDFLTSNSRNDVISWPMQITPMIAPSGPNLGAALSMKTRGSPEVDISTSNVA
mmetsp:Transcript_73807/g.213795  ORF Transcript_73807/g.213795 Transcript_73807/m.213795 type:complete len:210 (+) Transcript_73807:2364-2993(+)